MKIALCTLVALVCLNGFSQAPNEESDTDKALNEVMEMLVSPEQRKKILDVDAKAKQADDFALQVGGTPANQQKIYEISAKIMKELAAQGQSDPEAMMKILEEGRKDPESFAKKFPGQLDEIKALAAEIEKTQNKSPKTP